MLMTSDYNFNQFYNTVALQWQKSTAFEFLLKGKWLQQYEEIQSSTLENVWKTHWKWDLQDRGARGRVVEITKSGWEMLDLQTWRASKTYVAPKCVHDNCGTCRQHINCMVKSYIRSSSQIQLPWNVFLKVFQVSLTYTDLFGKLI